MPERIETLLNTLPSLILYLSQGMLVSLEVFFLTILFSVPLGLIVSFGRMSKLKIISVPVNVYMLIRRKAG